MCQGGFAVVGDQLSASSPFDPSFWVVHPSIERLWMWKKLQTSATLFRSFADEAWPTKGAAMVEGCTGHAAHDDVPFVERRSDGSERRFYTNQELYQLFDPMNPELPYLYDNFDWGHCHTAALGHDAAHATDDTLREGGAQGTGDESIFWETQWE